MYLKKGQKLHNGKYQLLNMIGEGGFSLTYKGSCKTIIQGSLGKIPILVPVCIKEYFFKDYCLRDSTSASVITNSVTGKETFEKYKERLIKEATILSEVHHPNIVRVLEAFKENNTVYIIMEFISGKSLKQKFDDSGIFEESELLKIIYKIGQALQFVHDKNILHLDIKPSNILMNNMQNPILIDFGISKRYDLSDQQETSTTVLAASKGYASIEQYDSEGMQSFSPKPDIYSLGATMYFLLTGHTPTESILRSTKGLEEPRKLNPKISENTEKVILKAMSINPSDRYESVLDMIIDLGFNMETDKIILPSSESNNDKTVLIQNTTIKDFSSGDNDATILQNEETKKTTNNSKRLKWLAFILCILIIATGFTYIYGNKAKINSTLNENDLFFEKHYKEGINQFFKQNFSQSKDEFSKALEYKEDSQTRYYIAKIDSLSLLILDSTENNIKENNNENTKPDSESTENKDVNQIHNSNEENLKQNIEKQTIDEERKKIEEYDLLFANAIKMYENKNYEAAKENFIKAGKIKKNSEIENYINLIDKDLDKIKIEEKKEQYEIKMNFGNFVIVRKKSNNLYGAIDATGNEVIECKYLIAEPSGTNKAFQRVDGSLLYDIYSPEGKLIREGEKSY